MLLERTNIVSGFISITKDTNTLLLPNRVIECIKVFKVGVIEYKPSIFKVTYITNIVNGLYIITMMNEQNKCSTISFSEEERDEIIDYLK